MADNNDTNKPTTPTFRVNKSYIGQHDYAKPFCMQYCTKNKLHCPFYDLKKTEKTKFPTIHRWIDVEMDNSGYNLDLVYHSEQFLDDERGPQFSCYGDGSGFEYDLMQPNLIGPNSVMETVYDFYNYGIQTRPLDFQKWNTWLDKFQYDYRFGRVSDQNATTVMFPNVDNPWMMTEYVFQGTGKVCHQVIDENDPGDDQGNKRTFWKSSDVTEIVIQPPLYDPDTLKLINGDVIIEDSNAFDAKYKGLDHDSNSHYKQFRRLENWDKFNGNYEKQGDSNWSGIDAGVKLYKVNVNVQCVKWGEHGNVPPHTINMTAPKDYFDPTKTIAKIRPVWTLHHGTPLYAKTYGAIGWQDRFAYITNGFPTFTKDSNANIWHYTTYESQWYKQNGVPQNNPVDPNNKRMGMQYTNIYLNDNDLSHGGCEFIRAGGGVVHCQALDEGLLSNSDYFYPNYCLHHETYGGDPTQPFCPKYVTSQEYPIIASYDHKATNMAEFYERMGFSLGNEGAKTTAAKNFLQYSTGMPMGDAFTLIMTNAIAQSSMIKPEQYTPQDEETYYTLDYEIQSGTLEQPQITGTTEQFGKNVQITPGTGKYAFDTRENANVFKGDDTNVYGDISTLNFHRFFSPIMHCATQQNCNPVCGLMQSWGYEIGKRAQGDGKCRYYKEKIGEGPGCPTSCIPKRALQFGQAMNNSSLYFEQLRFNYNELVKRGIWCLTDGKSNSQWIKGEKKNTFYLDNEKIYWDKYWFKQEQKDGKVIAIGINSSNSFSNLGNSYKKIDDNILIGKFRLSDESQSNTIQMYLTSQKNTWSSVSNSYHLAQASFFWYQPLTDSNQKLVPTSYNHVDEQGFWLCKADTSYIMPVYNSVIIDNEKKFMGGYHPQYKDYGQMGDEFMQSVEDPNDEIEREENAEGDRVYNHVPVVVNKKGYWIDASGVWITDERSTGIENKIASDKARKQANGGKGTVCISIKKSNTQTGGSSGEIEPSRTINAAVFANDPYDLVVTKFQGLREYDIDTEKFEGRPMLDGDDKTYYAPVIIKDENMLPTMRKALYCSVCDYYMAYVYKTIENKCPWCGQEFIKIDGDKGIGLEEFGKWDSNASVIKKFFKLNAIGQIQMWGPPGTCVHTDAYFWKNQNHISNGFKRQIYHRLGYSNKDKGGGGWRFDQMTPKGQMTLGYPQSLGKFVSIPDKIPQNTSYKDGRYAKLKWSDKVDTNQLGKYAMWNDISPEKYIPDLYLKSNMQDEGLISPYSADEPNISLKMVSYEQMRVLRNALQPMLAYTSDPPAQYDYPVLRASFDKREQQDQLIVYRGKRATVDPIILATTFGYADAYVEYNSGDLSIGNVREFYPNGYTWWYMKQMIGGRISTCTGGEYHMDSQGGQGGPVDWPPAGRTTAYCAIFIYGMLPLDKQILKAYIVIPPGNKKSAYKKPVGKRWTGGAPLCWHYHPSPVEHAKKRGSPYGKDGQVAHLHGNAGFGGDVWFDDDGLYYQNYEKWKKEKRQGMIYYLDESHYQNWGINNIAPDDNWYGWYDFKIENMTNIPIMYDKGFYANVGTNKVPVFRYSSNSTSSELIGYGYNSTINNGWQQHNIDGDYRLNDKYQYICLDSNSDIKQKFTAERIWKTQTREEMQSKINEGVYNANFRVSDGEEEIEYTIYETQNDLYKEYIPQQKQQITGYFDMSWTHTSDDLWGEYTVDENRKSILITQETILQDESEQITASAGGTQEKGKYSGSSNKSSTGQTPHYLDVTELVKKLYNNRVEREFECQAGSSTSSVYAFKYEDTKKGGTLESIDKDILEVVKARNEENLLDVVSYPEIEEDGTLSPIPSEGDKYPMAPTKLEIRCEVSGFPYDIINNRYKVQFNYKDGTTESNSGSVSTSYPNIEELKKTLSEIFTCENDTPMEIKQQSQLVLCIAPGNNSKLQSVDVITIPFDIPTRKYFFEHDRITQVNSYIKNHHPNNLFHNGVWRFEDYLPDVKYFEIDLASAPVCLQQKNYRYRASSVNYSSCHCTNEWCQVNQEITASIAASMYEKRFDPSSKKCPLCGSDLNEDQAIRTPGDGIMTYTYDKLFHPDPIIRKITVKPYKYPDISNSQVTTVSVRYDNSPYWKTLIYTDGSNAVSWSNSTEDLQRARYIKVECTTMPVQVKEIFNVNQEAYDSNSWELRILGDFSNMRGLSFQDAKLLIVNDQSDENETEEQSSEQLEEEIDDQSDEQSEEKEEEFWTRIVYAVEISDNEMKLVLSDYAKSIWGSNPPLQVAIRLNKYVGGIQSLSILGKHYKTEDNGLQAQKNKYLTITGHYETQAIPISYSQALYSLANVPTQIKSVQIGTTDGGGIKLNQVNEKNTTTFKWLTKQEGKIKRIVRGDYYYNVQKGGIEIPIYNQSNSHWSTYEQSNSTGVSYMPTTLFVEYWSGNGQSVTLPASANGNGPSYQLEKGAIQFIRSGKFQQNGKSCRMIDVDGKIVTKDIPWACFNSKSAGLSVVDASQTSYIAGGNWGEIKSGKFDWGMFTGSELAQSNKNVEKDFKSLFGTYGSNLKGHCTTEMTFVGAPNKVISGKIKVYAKPITEKEVRIDANTTIKTWQRTGGIGDGILIVSVQPNLNGEQGRLTVTHGMPKLYIYAKDRKPTDPIR